MCPYKQGESQLGAKEKPAFMFLHVFVIRKWSYLFNSQWILSCNSGYNVLYLNAAAAVNGCTPPDKNKIRIT